eukprot:NODE_90_length_2706_cov_70.163242_g86_i0.p1 GENE.NODE_90_length_2706_cov_70.163242_g86_i0~~NODE_90_length_2706_cov_70.163242_g86_i0.p1  ORF type:complete len:876 (-),score=216.77 NODE_90_length_2706_cov_70.163242_g86_i0:77-2323(-)
MDDPNLEDNNVKDKVDHMVKWANEQAEAYRTKNILIPMGEDFQYQQANFWFKNIDKIIKYANEDGRVNVLYSDPNIYTWAMNQADEVMPLKDDDDYMPLQDEPGAFWSGFFTSRPTLKRFVFVANKLLQTARQIAAVAGVASNGGMFDSLQAAIGLGVHHDAITGTEKQHVAFDYAKRLAAGIGDTVQATAKTLQTVSNSTLPWKHCLLLNQSMCDSTADVGNVGAKDVRVLVWNPKSQAQSVVTRIPIGGLAVSVIDERTGQAVRSQVLEAPKSTTNYKDGNGLKYEVWINTSSIPAMGFATFRLQSPNATSDFKPAKSTNTGPNPPASFPRLENEYLIVQFGTNRLESITDKRTGVTVNVTQNWGYYRDNDKVPFSGAYLMELDEGEKPRSFGDPTISVYGQPDMGVDVRMHWHDWLYQSVRLPVNSKYVEIEYTVGPVPHDPFLNNTGFFGSEVISTFTTNLGTNGAWKTDSNGRDMMQRKRNYRKYYNFNNTQQVAGNYFPVSTAASIAGNDAQLTILTDTPQACGSINDGELEFLVHRRLSTLDFRGVTEILDETEFITPYKPIQDDFPTPGGVHYGPGLRHRGRHWITVGQPDGAAAEWRDMADQMFFETNLWFQEADTGDVSHAGGSAVSGDLPANVALLTVERLTESSILLRLAHQYAVDEDPVLSANATVNINSLFPSTTIKAIKEMSLTANQPITDVKPLKWRVAGEASPMLPTRQPVTDSGDVTLTPMQIRTFVLDV